MDKLVGAPSSASSGSSGSSWSITRFIQNEILDPRKISANLGVLYGTTVFAGAVYFIEYYGEVLVQ